MIKGIVTYKPLKSGKISVLMEVESTKENIRFLGDMYGDEGILLSEQEMEAQPVNPLNNSVLGLLKETITMLKDIYNGLASTSAGPTIAILDCSELADINGDGIKEKGLLTAADELEPIQLQNVGIFGEDQI